MHCLFTFFHADQSKKLEFFYKKCHFRLFWFKILPFLIFYNSYGFEIIVLQGNLHRFRILCNAKRKQFPKESDSGIRKAKAIRNRILTKKAIPKERAVLERQSDFRNIPLYAMEKYHVNS